MFREKKSNGSRNASSSVQGYVFREVKNKAQLALKFCDLSSPPCTFKPQLSSCSSYVVAVGSGYDYLTQLLINFTGSLPFSLTETRAGRMMIAREFVASKRSSRTSTTTKAKQWQASNCRPRRGLHLRIIRIIIPLCFHFLLFSPADVIVSNEKNVKQAKKKSDRKI